MSSPKAAKSAATKSARKPAVVAKMKEAATRTVAPKIKSPQSGLSADAIRLAGEIEQAFKKSDDAISAEAMQTLMSALCRVYAAQVENGANYTPIPEGQVVSPTGVMVTASGLLKAANLAVFELGMWQSWTGR
ncbi:MAG: hypothetical protein K2Y27_14720 [Xanthobacteraceae bacterium]|nr:hypothetical protein [Xanthobacteraceae bacterium]